MRFVPYDEGQLTPEWIERPADRPRIVVAASSPTDPGDGLTRAAIRAARRTEAELVLLRPALDPARPLPRNVRVVEWTSLAAVLPTCAGIVHHGGAATALGALATGVPQLVIPDAGDRWHHARLVARRGVGLVSRRLTPRLLERLVTDDALTVASAEVRGELAGGLGPEEIAGRLVELATRTPPRQASRRKRRTAAKPAAQRLPGAADRAA